MGTPMSDTARAALEKQLQLLLKDGEKSPNERPGERAMAILNLVEALEADDRLRERNARWEESFKGMIEYEEAQKLAEQREMELEEKRRRMRFALRTFEIISLCGLLGALLHWLL